MAGLAFGAGIGKGGLAVDYAWTPLGLLGSAHRISVSLAWDAPAARERRSAGPSPEPPARRPQGAEPTVHAGEDHLRWLFANLKQDVAISLSLKSGARISGKFRGFVLTKGTAGGRWVPPQAAREDVLLRPEGAGFFGEQSFALVEIDSATILEE